MDSFHTLILTVIVKIEGSWGSKVHNKGDGNISILNAFSNKTTSIGRHASHLQCQLCSFMLPTVYY